MADFDHAYAYEARARALARLEDARMAPKFVPEKATVMKLGNVPGLLNISADTKGWAPAIVGTANSATIPARITRRIRMNIMACISIKP